MSDKEEEIKWDPEYDKASMFAAEECLKADEDELKDFVAKKGTGTGAEYGTPHGKVRYEDIRAHFADVLLINKDGGKAQLEMCLQNTKFDTENAAYDEAEITDT